MLIYGEFGQMAQTDPDELIANLRIMEQRTQQLLPPGDAAPILNSLAEVRAGCESPKKSEADWNLVEVQAKRVSSRLQAASSLLTLTESNMLGLALQLGRIYHRIDDLPAAKIRNAVEAKVQSMLPAASGSAIKSTFAAAEKLTSGYRWAMRIYGLLNHEIGFRL